MRIIKLHTQTAIVSIVSALLLSACGSSDRTTTAPVIPPPTGGTEVVACDTGTTDLNKEDKVVALIDGTQVRVSHNQDGTKSVCVLIGEAEVL